MRNKVHSLMLLPVLGLMAGCSGGNTPTNTTAAAPVPALYVETNSLAAGSNAVLAYSRGTTGALTSIGSYTTGGNGTGLPTTGLPFPIGGATGSILISPNGKYLYAVDAGSNDIAAFAIANDATLTLIGRYPTGGTAPASIAIDSTNSYLYALNTGTQPNGVNVAGGITGFSIGSTGALATLTGSTRPLSVAQYVDPSEVSFSPDGTYLVVTEKGTNAIDIYPVTSGVAGAAITSPSAGSIPFGFAFTKSGTMVVANAESTTVLTAATLSSYTANSKGVLTVVSSRVGDNQAAACWVALTSDGLYAYTTNTLSGSISGYSVSSGGALALLTPGGVTAAQPNTTGPIDDIVSPDNKYLYVIDSNAGKAPGTIAGFAIGTGGTLTPVTTTTATLIPGSVGLAVR